MQQDVHHGAEGRGAGSSIGPPMAVSGEAAPQSVRAALSLIRMDLATALHLLDRLGDSSEVRDARIPLERINGHVDFICRELGGGC